ncbi:hypothetical protein HY488_00150 [Candidatus Woesearchaeota archaeon]|nr:hypothetical protein [Candidatus Woesearchaeota archaeon]
MPAPSYVARPNIRRVMIPTTLKTLLLCIIFYVSVQLNLYLFVKYRVLATQPPVYISYAIASVLFLLLAIEVLNVYRKYTVIIYDFYPDRVELYGRKPATLQLASVSNVQLKRNLFDSFFKTGTLVFQPAFRIEHITEPEQVLAYAQGLIAQARGGGMRSY